MTIFHVIALAAGTATAVAQVTVTTTLWANLTCYVRPGLKSVDGKEKEKSTSLIIDGSLQQESEGFKATKSFAHWVKVTWPHQKMSPEASAIVKRYASNNKDKEQHLLTCQLQVDRPSCHHDAPDVLHHQLSYAQKEAKFILNLLVTDSTAYECAVYTTIHNGTESTSATCPAEQGECWSTWLYIIVSILVAAVTVILDRLFLRDQRTQLQARQHHGRNIQTLSPRDRLPASAHRRQR